MINHENPPPPPIIGIFEQLQKNTVASPSDEPLIPTLKPNDNVVGNALKDRILKFEAPSAATKNEQTSTRKPQHGKLTRAASFSSYADVQSFFAQPTLAALDSSSTPPPPPSIKLTDTQVKELEQKFGGSGVKYSLQVLHDQKNHHQEKRYRCLARLNKPPQTY